jgi:hypothetical protein
MDILYFGQPKNCRVKANVKVKAKVKHGIPDQLEP